MGRQIVMNDGTIYEDATIGYNGGVIWCNVPNKTIADVIPDFTDHQKTEKLIFQYGEDEDVYEGYTTLGAILQQENMAQIQLKRGEADVRDRPE